MRNEDRREGEPFLVEWTSGSNVLVYDGDLAWEQEKVLVFYDKEGCKEREYGNVQAAIRRKGHRCQSETARLTER